MKNFLLKKKTILGIAIVGIIIICAAFAQIARADHKTTLTWTLYAEDPSSASCVFDQKNDGVLIWDDSDLPHDFTTDGSGAGAGINISPTNTSFIQVITDDTHPDLNIAPQLLTSDGSIAVRPIENGFILHKRDATEDMNSPFFVLLQGAVLPKDPNYTPDPDFTFVYTWQFICQ